MKSLRLLLLAAAAFLCGGAAAQALTVKMLPGECWWGGLDNPRAWKIQQAAGDYSFPFTESSSLSMDFTTETYSNNCVPFFVSTAGRYIWSDAPFKVEIKSGTITVDGPAPVELVQAGKTLREAFLAASAAHFRPKGEIPPEEFITRPQYNTWIELMYNQNQADILRYAHAIADNGFPTGAVLMVDDNWQKYYGNYDFPGQGFDACSDQYMLGPKYLVAPMLSPGTSRTVKLPKGRWSDETGRRYKGGKTYTISVPIDRIPVFTKVK